MGRGQGAGILQDVGQIAYEGVSLTRGSLHGTPLSSGLVVARSLGGGAMNLASLVADGGLQTQINPLAGVLGGSTTGLRGASSVPK